MTIKQYISSRTPNVTFCNNFDSKDAYYCLGSATGTFAGPASVHDNRLDLSFQSVPGNEEAQWIEYSADLNADSQQEICIRFKYYPQFSGAAALPHGLFWLGKGEGEQANQIHLSEDGYGSGNLLWQISATEGTMVSEYVGPYAPLAVDQCDIFEINANLTTGLYTLFKNKKIFKQVSGVTGTRTDEIGLFKIGGIWDNGSAPPSNGMFGDVVIWNKVQHTTDHENEYSDYEVLKYPLPISTIPCRTTLYAYIYDCNGPLGNIPYKVRSYYKDQDLICSGNEILNSYKWSTEYLTTSDEGMLEIPIYLNLDQELKIGSKSYKVKATIDQQFTKISELTTFELIDE